MASDPAGDEPAPAAAARDRADASADAVGRLRAVLAAAAGPGASADPTPRELAELLWLAARLPAPAGAAAPAPEPEGRKGLPAAAGERPPAPNAATGAPSAPPPRRPRPDPPRPAHPDGRIPLHLPEPSRPGTLADGTALLAPAPPMLHHTLALQRGLRPLQRKVPAARARVLDERATADRIARLGAHPDVWLPVLRPAPDRWLRLNLVHDAGPTMPVWRPLVRELHTVLSQSGIFRTVTAHPAGPDGRARGVPAVADGRTVTLIVTDCMGPQWRPGPAGDRWYRTLRRWAERMPLAVVQPLPEHLWAGTALPAEAGLLTPPAAAAPSAALVFTPYAPDAPVRPPSAVPVPVLEPGPAWLANWAALVADPGAGRVPGAVAWLPPAPLPPAGPAPDVAELSAEDLVLRFRATASPEAFRLAGHLSLAVPSLPVMRLAQRALERSPRPQHLAEIVLSGLLTAVPGPPGSYAFRPGVRELLLRSLPRTARGRTRELLARIGGLIDERAGFAAGEFRAQVRNGAGARGTAFATVSEETVRRLGGDRAGGRLVGGRYRLVGRRETGRRVWEAVDERTGGPVVVHLYPAQTSPERFLREARALLEVDDPHVVRVLDHGLEGDRPYLVAEFLDGVTVRELEDGSGPGVSFGVFARLAAQTTAGLQALHAHGLVRGRPDADGLLLRPDGTVVISRFALGREAEGKDPAQDFTELGRLVQRLARHVTAPARYQELVREIEHSPASQVSRSAVAELARVSWPRRMRFELLGRPAVRRYDGSVLPVPHEAEALLCMLLLRHGRRVPLAELTEGLWDTPPPGSPADRVRALAGELGACLGPGALAALPDGYALHAPDDYIDVRHCEELLARRTPGPGPRERRRAIQKALDLWYGDPLERVPGPAAQAARARLRALRLTLCATRAELDLELGDHERAAADLGALLRDHPHREDLRRLHILALRGTGRVAEAVESYESYAEYRQRQHGEPVDPALQELYRELRAAPERPRPTIVFEAVSGLDEQARRVLGLAVTRLLAQGELATHQYEVLARAGGYTVLTEPDADVRPVLADVLHALPEALAGLERAPRMRVTFWRTARFADADRPAEPADVRAALEGAEGDLLVVASPALYEEFADGPSAHEAARFRPLRSGAPDAPPLAWYCPLVLAARPPRAAERDLVRGPFTVADPVRLPDPEPGRTAVVLAPPDGPPAVLRPGDGDRLRAGRPTTYYEVDLTTQRAVHEVSLPGSRGGVFAASVELSWYVDDPVVFVAAGVTRVGDRLLGHVLAEAPRLTGRHPVGRAGAAQQAVREGLRGWPVPGLSVACSVRLAPGREPLARPVPSLAGTLRGLLRDAGTVLLGFEGPLTRPYSARTAREAALDLLSLVAEHRDPEDALAGRPLLAGDGSFTASEELVHPLDVLRAFAGRSVGRPLARRLDRLELRAVAEARPTPHAAAFVRALHAAGRRTAVVTDFSETAVHRFLGRGTVPVRDVHGRDDDPRLLMPDPDCLLRALYSPGVPAPAGVLIGSSVAEFAAARQLGVAFVGLADSAAADRRLREAGCKVTVPSLEPLLEATRAL
ncbi:SAV_2336 N-terminal domain-related protein [Streptomyces sp. NPDC052309]|uniref:SAV_2336 N-terminal domain-related protein n=1 Tax=Streptomyces sp. NPDC052309 TaxID=3155421 RepID=UPI003421A1B2